MTWILVSRTSRSNDYSANVRWSIPIDVCHGPIRQLIEYQLQNFVLLIKVQPITILVKPIHLQVALDHISNIEERIKRVDEEPKCSNGPKLRDVDIATSINYSLGDGFYKCLFLPARESLTRQDFRPAFFFGDFNFKNICQHLKKTIK